MIYLTKTRLMKFNIVIVHLKNYASHAPRRIEKWEREDSYPSPRENLPWMMK